MTYLTAQRFLVTLPGAFCWSFGVESRHEEAKEGEAIRVILS